MWMQDNVIVQSSGDPLAHMDESIRTHRLLSSRQTAALLNCSTVHLRRLARGGKIPQPLRIGDRKLAWRASEITTLLKA